MCHVAHCHTTPGSAPSAWKEDGVVVAWAYGDRSAHAWAVMYKTVVEGGHGVPRRKLVAAVSLHQRRRRSRSGRIPGWTRRVPPAATAEPLESHHVPYIGGESEETSSEFVEIDKSPVRSPLVAEKLWISTRIGGD